MRAAVFCALALLVASTLHVASTAAATAGQSDEHHKRAKPSSFAPHPGAHNRVYGAPIQTRILKSRPKKQPQLASAPLPG